MSDTTAQSEKSGQPRRGVRVLVVSVWIILVLVGSLGGTWWIAKHRAARARAQWKGPALERLAELSITNDEIHRELDELKAWPIGHANFRWAHDHVLLMTNGEHIIYASRHGANSGFVDHLFLGRGSDGRWFYSTYHFCNSMVGVLNDDPPASIAEFTKMYWAREFDGKSDVCLQHTWPLNK